MPDMFETHDRLNDILSLLYPKDFNRHAAIDTLRQWLKETELDIDQFETSQWEQHMEENYQMTIVIQGGINHGKIFRDNPEN